MGKTRLPEENAAAVLERSEGVCEAQIPDVCTGRAVHMHHRKFRSGGEDHSVPNLIHICDSCHNWIHAWKRTARTYGWAISSHGGHPASAHPVLYRGRLAHLTETGGVDFQPVRYRKPLPAGLDPWESEGGSR